MRSKIGIKSRLAAHILALILLIIMLVYLAPGPQTPNGRGMPATMPSVATPAEPVVAPPVRITPVERQEEPAVPDHTPTVIEPGPAEPDAEAEAAGNELIAAIEDSVLQADETEAIPVSDETPVDGDGENGNESEPAVSQEPETVSGDDDAQPAATQPDETGSLVVAASDSGDMQPMISPLANANLEVLGDGVYWLASRHEFEKEMAAIPEVATLILLAPLPGYKVHEFEHIQPVIISADSTDLDFDAAEQFIYLTDEAPRPVVVAALPGARGAAFFKGAYLLRNRNLSHEEVVREIEPELDEAGPARDEIIHRLARLNDQ